MKTRFQPFKTNQASTLLAVALLAVIVGGALASYLLIVKDETMRGFRSQTWNTSLMAAEAGVEDALALVNKNEFTTNVFTNWINTAASQDNWKLVPSAANSKVFSMTRTLGAGANYVSTYTVYITCTVTNLNNGPIWIPTILSIGTVSNLYGPPAVRKVLVQTVADANVTGGLIAQTAMDFNGNNTMVDSFDSSDPLHSAWQTNLTFNGTNYGFYSFSNHTAEAVVGTDGSIIDVGNADIYGYVDTGPGGAVSIQKNGSVGDLNWVPTPGVQTTPTNHLRDDMNVVFSDAILPTPTNSYFPVNPTWLPVTYIPSGTNITVTNYVGTNAIASSSTYNYVINNNPLMPGTPTNMIYYEVNAQIPNLFVNASNVVLYVPSGASFGSQSALTLCTNSSIEIYSGDTFDTQNGTVNNFTQYAPPLRIFGLPGCTAITFGGNGMLTAWIYAPEASVNFNGGGSDSKNTYDIVGSFLVHDVQVNGHYNFHFDERLKWFLPPFRYVADNWQEVH